MNSVPLFSLFFKNIFFHCCSTTALRQTISKTTLTWKVKLIRKTTFFGHKKAKHEKKTMSTLYTSQGRKLRTEQGVIFQDLNGKTAVALRCLGAHRDCMLLMHRIWGDFSKGRARELGRVLNILLLFLLLFVLIIVLRLFFVVAVKELVEMLLKIMWLWPLSGVIHLL